MKTFPRKDFLSNKDIFVVMNHLSEKNCIVHDANRVCHLFYDAILQTAIHKPSLMLGLVLTTIRNLRKT